MFIKPAINLATKYSVFIIFNKTCNKISSRIVKFALYDKILCPMTHVLPTTTTFRPYYNIFFMPELNRYFLYLNPLDSFKASTLKIVLRPQPTRQF